MTNKVESGAIDETAAQDSVKMSTVSASEILRKIQGADGKDITKLKEVLAQIGHEADSLPAGASAEANRKSIDMKTVKEDLKTIFAGQEDLSEEFLEQVATLFEAAVHLRVSEIEEEIYEAAATELEEALAAQEQELVESIEDYLDGVITEWKEENSLAIESTVKTLQMESFMEGLKELFLEHDVDVPEESLDLVESLNAEVEELKSQLNDALNENIELKNVLEDANLEMAFDEISEGLAATQVEKLRTLSESVDFKSVDEYKEKVKLIKEAHFSKGQKDESLIVEEAIETPVIEEEKKPVAQVSQYAAAISKSVKTSRL